MSAWKSMFATAMNAKGSILTGSIVFNPREHKVHMDPFDQRSKPRTRLRVQNPSQQACPQPQMYVVTMFAGLG